MKKLFTFLFATLFGLQLMAQNDGGLPKVYNEEINAIEQIEQALEQARAEGKYVVCQVGGNWCPWCLRFADFITKTESIANVIEKNFVYIHLNTSKKNKNEEMLQRLENPGRFGYPVFVILDQEGRRIHTQNSSYLEEGKGYNEKKVLDFFLNWTPEAVKSLK